MERRWIGLGAALMALGVALGAFGAHGLKDMVSTEKVATWETAAHYHQLHALALILIGALPAVRGRDTAAKLILAGLAIFSGSLYLYVLTGKTALAMATPLGGLFMIAGWIVLSVAFFRKDPQAG